MFNEWENIPGITSQKRTYRASIVGEIQSVNNFNGKVYTLAQCKNNGYMKVLINKKIYQVHYLVAITFVTKPDNFDDTFTVDHIDNDCTNNSADNLRWVNKFVQVDNRRDTCRIHIHSLPVIAKNIASGEILEFASLHEASEKIKEADFRHISSCVNNKRKTHAGYLWYPPDTLPDEEGEIWKHITTTPRYNLHISSFGRIGYEFSCGYTKKIWSKDMISERGIERDRYPSVNIGGKEMCLHILVWNTFVGDIPSGLIVNHIDHDKQNASLDNLEVITRSANAIAAHDAGRYDNSKSSRVEISINGITYKSLSEASTKLGISRQSVKVLGCAADPTTSVAQL
ncbi:hypothetical protein PBCVAP110A_515R [Paramecium bursaria Chlorella virus AP110A]|nr:hypothetical protein PBCVAP110A_515R [Paramecium bursaria Chlorella virus AP110A]AGE58026.1 hypothetical protein PBCVNW6652_499R [Paramecium bursaria Chlorella virus NW665.2]